MARKRLDLSHVLTPLENEFRETLEEICALKKQDSPLFDAAIENFISKYGGSGYRSLEDLLNSSALQAQSLEKDTIPFEELIKDLLA